MINIWLVILFLVASVATSVAATLSFVGQRSHRPKQREPVCGCGHHLAVHDPETKRCHGSHSVPKYNTTGNVVGHDWGSCGCRQYIGPEPIHMLWIPPVAKEVDQ